jgi:hypothetical protein
MKPINWLEKHMLGFRDLPEPDREAIFDFALLWSLFEAKALETRASSESITRVVQEWALQGNLADGDFGEGLAYFSNRYFPDGVESNCFSGLNLRSNDNPEFVKRVLRSRNNTNVETAAVVLIITYRLRNNLFHGVKWVYNLSGQRSNFEHSNRALMAALSKVLECRTTIKR